MTEPIPQIVFDWAQRAFEGTIIKHDGVFYRAGEEYSIPAETWSSPNGVTMDIMLCDTKRVVEKLVPARVREENVVFVRDGIEGTRKVYVLND